MLIVVFPSGGWITNGSCFLFCNCLCFSQFLYTHTHLNLPLVQLWIMISSRSYLMQPLPLGRFHDSPRWSCCLRFTKSHQSAPGGTRFSADLQWLEAVWHSARDIHMLFTGQCRTLSPSSIFRKVLFNCP